MLTPLIRSALLVALALQTSVGVAAETVPERDRYFVTSDNVRLHYIEAGPNAGHTILFIPGLAMPAWIWERQLQFFGRHYHVTALDPRGQGNSEVPPTGYEPMRRGQDIAEAIAHLEPVPLTIVGWSLGVLDSLAYLHTHGDSRVAGLVLVDNSVGEEPAPAPTVHPPWRGPPLTYAAGMRLFVRGLFEQPQSAEWLDRLTQASLVLPESANHALRSYPMPRTYWREAVYSTALPVLYMVRPRWEAQAENLVRKRPNTEAVLFTNAGHALFVDEPARFDSLLDTFLRSRVWP